MQMIFPSREKTVDFFARRAYTENKDFFIIRLREGRSMKNYVITIARENGSGGRAIGEALAGRIGIPFYNRDILRMAADDSGINEQLFANAEKSFRSSLLFRVAKDAYNGEVIPPDSDNFVSNENLFR